MAVRSRRIFVKKLIEVADSLLRHNIDGVVWANTTLDRSLVQRNEKLPANGGLSGRPLQLKAQKFAVYRGVKGTICLLSASAALTQLSPRAKIAAGATLVQIYSGFIFKARH